MEGQKPKLKELKNYVIPHMGPKWEDLGIELELDDDGKLLDDIKEERRGNEEKCCLDVVKKWLQGAGVDPKTWGKLLECLRVIDATDAITSVEKNILKGPGTSHSSETDESLLQTNVPTDPEQKPVVQPLLQTNVRTDPEQLPVVQPLLQTNIPTDPEQKPVVQPLLQTNVPTDPEQKPVVQPLLQTNVPTDQEQKPVIQPLLQTNIPIDPEHQPAIQPLLRTNIPIDPEHQPAIQPLLRTNVPTDPEQLPVIQPLLETNVPTDSEQKPVVQPLLDTNIPIDPEQLPVVQPLLRTNIPTGPEQLPVIQPLLETNVPTVPEQKPVVQPLLETNVPTDPEQKPVIQPLLQTNVSTGPEQLPAIQPLLQTNVPTDPEQLPAIQPLLQTNVPTDPEQLPAIQPLLRTNMITDPDQHPVFPEELREQPKPELHPRCLDYSFQLEPGHQVRNYQRELAEPGIQGENYIICAPTGTGKTLVAALVISDHLQKKRQKGKVIFMVDKKPLARQQAEALKKLIPQANVNCSTGDDIGITVKLLLPESDIIVCTAGKLLNELTESHVKFSNISLVIIDECHHTLKNSPHARVMEKYLEKKRGDKSAELPQVIGLTASPGAGDNPTLKTDVTVEHLISLCALMDATSGIKTVSRYKAELEQHTNKPDFTLSVLKCRDTGEPFVKCVTREMEMLEQSVALKCPFTRWSQEYETSIQQKKKEFEDSPNPANRDQISTLELLRCYTKMLNFYMDLRFEDAISVLDGFKGLPSDDRASTHERGLSERLICLKTELDELPRVKNPLLQSVEDILTNRFTRKPDSKAILFVRTKKHASSMCEWIDSLPDYLNIKPQVVTGHTRETGQGMTQIQQQQAIQDFHGNKCNLLVATSVAEEGLDVPACNLVLRFQHVSNEIAKVQTRGRARAADSEGFTILANTKKTFQELRNGKLEVLVEKILASDGNGYYFPTGRYLREAVLEKQQRIIRDRAFQRQVAMSQGQKRKQKQSSDKLQLKCKRCKILACSGSDIYTLEKATQYVVPEESFKQKISIQPQKSPKRITESMTFTDVVNCAECDSEWGVMCTWPAAGYNLPILKCINFNFEVDGKLVSVKKWSEAPFEIPPLSSHPDYRTPDTESNDTDDSSD